jgi:hypothetical protein
MSVWVQKHGHDWLGYVAVVGILSGGLVLLWMLLNDWAKILTKWMGSS